MTLLYYFRIIPFNLDLYLFYVFNHVIILYPADFPIIILLKQTYNFVKC
jgi:hypothetical protein